MSDTTAEDKAKTLKESNEDRRRDKLQRQVRRAHEWRVQVWAQSELRIREAQSGLEVLGTAPVDLFVPNFGDDEMLHQYANMTVSR